MDEIEILSHEEGEYRIRIGSRDGDTSLTVVLANVADVSQGLLADDAMTARATTLYLLGHQEARDLPGRIEFEDMIVAYPDAVSRIEALRE